MKLFNYMSTIHDLLIQTTKAMAIAGGFSAGFSIFQVSREDSLICSALMNLNFILYKQNDINSIQNYW